MARVFAVAAMLMAFCVAPVRGEQAFDPRELFSEPVPLLDVSGKPLVTGKALATPYAADFDADGKIDLIIGAKLDMNTAEGGIWLVRNVGTNDKPLFDWAAAWEVKIGEQQPPGHGASSTSGLKIQCGCKSSGFVPVQAVDWNGDGWTDILFTDTYTRAYILINKRTSRDKPTFNQVKYFDFEKTNHGMHSGGGDWDGDGIRDFLYMPFAGSTYRLFKGDTLGGKGLHFQEGDCRSGKNVPMTGEKAMDCAWAWNFSGKCPPGVVEYVGTSSRDAADVEFYRLENGVSRKLGVVGKSEVTYVKLTASDLNGDGKMDVLYSGGVFVDPSKTKVWVLHGKVENIKKR